MESNFSNIERQTKTRTGAEPKDIRAVKPKMFSVPGSDRDPVQGYYLYASKRPEQMKLDGSPFYLAINYTRVGNSSKPWFKAAPMGSNKIKFTHENHGWFECRKPDQPQCPEANGPEAERPRGTSDSYYANLWA